MPPAARGHDECFCTAARRGQKAFFKLKNTFNNIPCSAPICMHIFDHTVKPVLVYASEIVGLFNNNKNVDPNFYNIPKFYLNSSVDPLDFQII
jgi:hypothetical protein